ncbi:MAG: LytR C-terminal domain-containing protein [Lapillicoccus sp.]
MSHVVESAASRKHRRNRRTAIILVVLAAVLAGAFYYAASYFNRPSTPAASGCPTGDFTAGAAATPTLAAGQVTVNVYNATNRAGLAASTAKDVKGRGFVVGQVSNDPSKKKIEAPAEVRFGPNGKAGAELVVKLVEGSTPTQDTRADASVDLVIGNGFKALAAAPTATPSATVPNPC